MSDKYPVIYTFNFTEIPPILKIYIINHTIVFHYTSSYTSIKLHCKLHSDQLQRTDSCYKD